MTYKIQNGVVVDQNNNITNIEAFDELNIGLEAGLIPIVPDVNGIQTSGSIWGVSNVTDNIPNGVAGVILTIKTHNNNILQILTGMGSNSKSRYTRFYADSVWSDWKEHISELNINKTALTGSLNDVTGLPDISAFESLPVG